MPIAAIAAVATIGSSLIGASAQASAAKKAANASAAGSAASLAEQKREFDTSRADNLPWLTTGKSALASLSKIYGLSSVGANGQVTPGGAPDMSSFFTSPDYQFRQTEGLKGVDAGAAARGTLDSGATRKAEIGYAGNLASGEFGSYINRLMGIAGVGQNAANANTQAGQNYANNFSTITQNAADTRASSYLAQGKSYADAIGQVGGAIGGALQNNQGWFSPSTIPTSTPTYNGSW